MKQLDNDKKRPLSSAPDMNNINAPRSLSAAPAAAMVSSNKMLSLFNATQNIPQDRDLDAVPLGFLSANRIVSVLEKAVERLELLALLDTTAPEDGPLQSFLPHIGGNGASAAEQTKSSATAPRKAAVLPSKSEDLSRKTVRAMNAALVTAASMQRCGRPTVADLVVEQQRLERRYGELLRQTQKVNPNPNEPELDRNCFAAVQDHEKTAIMEELRQTSRRLREHNKALFIQLKDNPNDADNWKKVGNERSELIQLLQAVIREITTGYGVTKTANTPGALLRSEGRYDRSAYSESIATEVKEGTLAKNRFGSTTQMRRAARGPAAPRIPLMSYFERFAKLIADEKSAQRWADELVLKEKELNQNVKQLQHDLKAEKALKEKEIAERRQRVAELKVSLRQEKKRLKEQNEMVRAEVEAAHETMQRKATDEERIVLEAMHGSEWEERVEECVHNDFKEHLIERTEAMDELAMRWDKKNQSEIKRVEARKIDVEQIRQQCAERLQKAQKDKEVEVQLKSQREEEQQREEAERTAAETQANMEYEAVSMIQSAIRGMFTRQALAVLKKKNKKKRKAAKA
ncbi:flagellar associated protein [Trypanosoma grayi]|uniref:flagellar associated protein n=1 Tax=Trypanosoma grayi TaxID=71804 RepID=UPI0004F41C7E|nr:flagellar associated protein [Trypanosoma grayi]KEG08987.1 flagellar associated protein [Trypanosoma grayi]